MYQWKNNAKVILPLALSVSISNALYSGGAIAKNYELNYIGDNPESSGISIKDTIAGDNNYDFTVKVDNPVRGEGNGLEVKIGNITSDQGGEYHIGNYNVNIGGTTQQDHRSGLAFFGLSAEGMIPK